VNELWRVIDGELDGLRKRCHGKPWEHKAEELAKFLIRVAKLAWMYYRKKRRPEI